MNTEERMTPEVIDVDEYEPEIEVVAQVLARLRSRPQDDKRALERRISERTAPIRRTPIVQSGLHTAELIDLTGDDDDDNVLRSSVQTAVSIPYEPPPERPSFSETPSYTTRSRSTQRAAAASIARRQLLAESASRATPSLNPQRTAPVSMSRRREPLTDPPPNESDWETLYDSLNLNDDRNWDVPISDVSHTAHVASDFRRELADAQEEARNSVYEFLKTHASDLAHFAHKPSIRLAEHIKSTGIWSKAAPILATHAARGCTRDPARVSALRETKYVGLLPGAINSISQSWELIAITSCVADGLAVTETEGIPYNREGTLVLIYDGRPIRLDGHHRPRDNPLNPVLDSVKYFSVSEAIFDPKCPTRLLSCGEDSRLNMWDCGGLADGTDPHIANVYHYPQGCIPRGMLFQPATSTPAPSILAVTCNTGEIYIHGMGNLQSCRTFSVTPEYTRTVHDIAWGVRSTGGSIFATSGLDDYDEHDPQNFFGGFHRAFDVESGRLLYSLNNEDAGECVAIDPLGDRLALATSTYSPEQGFRFRLDMYDIRRSNPDAIYSLPIESFPPPVNDGVSWIVKPRVNWLAFSPDGIFLAVARSDNRTQVYDTRFLGRRVLHDFRHDTPTEGSTSDGLYGVYKAEWLENRQYGTGLVTSGADGCVRLWDVRRACDTSTVLAKSDSYVSWFNLGDPLKREKAVVLGDGGGCVITKG